MNIATKTMTMMSPSKDEVDSEENKVSKEEEKPLLKKEAKDKEMGLIVKENLKVPACHCQG